MSRLCFTSFSMTNHRWPLPPPPMPRPPALAQGVIHQSLVMANHLAGFVHHVAPLSGKIGFQEGPKIPFSNEAHAGGILFSRWWAGPVAWAISRTSLFSRPPTGSSALDRRLAGPAYRGNRSDPCFRPSPGSRVTLSPWQAQVGEMAGDQLFGPQGLRRNSETR